MNSRKKNKIILGQSQRDFFSTSKCLLQNKLTKFKNLITDFSAPSVLRRWQRAIAPLQWNYGLAFRESVVGTTAESPSTAEKQHPSGTIKTNGK
jgi:hypothetical protein